MHSWSSRLSGILSFMSTVIMGIGAAIALTSFAFKQPIDAIDVDWDIVKLYRLHKCRNTQTDRAMVSFRVHVDFAPLLHWNSKQINAIIYANYSTDEFEDISQTVFYEILRDDTCSELNAETCQTFQIHRDEIVQSFPLDDIGTNLRDRDVTFRFCWEVVPHVGLIYQQCAEKPIEYLFPDEYHMEKLPRGSITPTDPQRQDWQVEYTGYAAGFSYYG